MHNCPVNRNWARHGSDAAFHGAAERGFIPAAKQPHACGVPRRHGMLLIELLCVTVIIGILSSLLLPAVFRVYDRVKATGEEWDAPEISNMLVTSTRNYCNANPMYFFTNKSDLADKCGLAPKCRDWVQSPTTEFFSFTYLDETNRLVLRFHFGRRHSSVYSYTKGELTLPAESH